MKMMSVPLAATAIAVAAAAAHAAPVNLDGDVSFQVFAIDASSNLHLAGDGVLSFTNGVGSTIFSGDPNADLSGGTFSIELTQASSQTRELSVLITSDDTSRGFIGATAPSITAIGWIIGDVLTAQPSQPFVDPLFAGLIGSSGNAFDLNGNPFVAGNPPGFYPTVVGNGYFGGGVQYFFTDGSPLNNLSFGSFTAQIEYSIIPLPGPAMMGLAGIGGLAFVRRRRG